MTSNVPPNYDEAANAALQKSLSETRQENAGLQQQLAELEARLAAAEEPAPEKSEEQEAA